MSNIKFLIIYLIAMVLTYLWRFAILGAAFDDSTDIGDMGNTVNILMLASYAIMAFVAYSRGKAIGKGYLAAFPIVGAVFDLVLVFVPFVPTVMNILTIVLGMPDNKSAETAQPGSSNT
ncbi:hypothetical protein [Microbulbifer sp. TYP-18]|uniref:hypothetical protein n=1 Tax=Microbulbifer sp. TYP-18 TaxID=3230024 RepID=UPI0034C5E5B0